MDEQMVPTLEKNIENSITEVFAGENFAGFLRIMAYFPHLNFKNQLLLWRQKRDATMIAGLGAIKASGRGLVEKAKPIMLLYPVITLTKPGKIATMDGKFAINKETGMYAYEEYPEYESCYKPVVVYDVSDMTGEVIDVKYELGNIEDRIRFLTKSTVECIREEKIPRYEELGFTKDGKTKRGRFVLPMRLKKAEQMRQLALLYTDYLIGTLGLTKGTEALPDYLNTNHFHELCKYVVLKHFGIEKHDRSLIPEKREPLTYEECHTFIRRLSEITSEVIMDLSDYCLTFDDTAIANNLIRNWSDSDHMMTEMTDRVIHVAEGLTDKALKKEIVQFRDKIFATKSGYLEELIKTIHAKRLYSFPPYPLELDIKERGG